MNSVSACTRVSKTAFMLCIAETLRDDNKREREGGKERAKRERER